ncbi:MAG: hypothetical protein JNK64_19585 [Myxococcales bacterium]|nr:hypothetical protein [Myxococcales bacterium]
MHTTITFALATLALALAAADARGDAPPPARALGADAVVALPVGDYADVASVAAGAMVRVAIPAGPAVATVRAGALLHAMKVDGASLIYVPVWAGARLPIGASGLFVAAELGVTIAHASVDTGFGDGADTKTELGASLGVGLRRGGLTVVGGLLAPDLGDTAALGASAGFDFATF